MEIYFVIKYDISSFLLHNCQMRNDIFKLQRIDPLFSKPFEKWLIFEVVNSSIEVLPLPVFVVDYLDKWVILLLIPI